MPSEPEVEAFKRGWHSVPEGAPGDRTRAGIASLRQWEQQHDAAHNLVIQLSELDARIIREILAAAIQNRDGVNVWIDPIDRAFKIKVIAPLATWSPPMGTPA